MFLKGYISNDLEPIIENVYAITKTKNIKLECILDTGFNGAFCLPRIIGKECELQYFGIKTFELADGSVIKEKSFIGEILINNEPLLIELTLIDSDVALIGMQLLKEKIAIFDLKTNTVRVEY